MQPDKTESDSSFTERHLDFTARIEAMKARLRDVKPELFAECQDCGQSVFHFHRRCTACDEARWAAMSIDERTTCFTQDTERLVELQKQITKLT